MRLHTFPRRGFTLIEILITLVVMSVIGAALVKLLANQTRYFDRQVGMRSARAVSRTAVSVLTSDLRMAHKATVIATDGSSITIRVPYRFGIVCSAPTTAGSPITAQMAPIDSAANAMATFAGWAYRSSSSPYRYTIPSSPSVTAASATNATLCNTYGTSSGVRPITLGSQTSAPMDLSPGNATLGGVVTVGQAVMFYQTITYQFKSSSAFPGRKGLWRTVAGGTSEELMAPFDGSSRFRYYFVTDDTSRTTVAASDTTNVVGVDLVLVGLSTKKAYGSSSYTKSTNVTSVFFRNYRGT